MTTSHANPEDRVRSVRPDALRPADSVHQIGGTNPEEGTIPEEGTNPETERNTNSEEDTIPEEGTNPETAEARSTTCGIRQTGDAPLPRYDAVLLVSFGGPEGPDDVMPFLANVTAGRDVPEERLAAVALQYHHTGGVSPLNEQCRRLRAALTERLDAAGHRLPVYWGNRNWSPLLADTVAEMADAGHRRVLAVATSAYSSYSGCRQYLEDIARARAVVDAEASAGAAGADGAGSAGAPMRAEADTHTDSSREPTSTLDRSQAEANTHTDSSEAAGSPVIDKIGPYYDHPGFIEPFADSAASARQSLPVEDRAGAVLLATAHSIPTAMARGCDYERQLRETARLVADRAGFDEWELVWQSRSGPPSVPWLEPDVNDYLTAHADRIRSVVLAPIGFVTDHMEVVWDLDVTASDTASRLGISVSRAVTPGTGPDERFVTMWQELIEERLLPGTPRRRLGSLGPRSDTCRPDCCPPWDHVG